MMMKERESEKSMLENSGNWNNAKKLCMRSFKKRMIEEYERKRAAELRQRSNSGSTSSKYAQQKYKTKETSGG